MKEGKHAALAAWGSEHRCPGGGREMAYPHSERRKHERYTFSAPLEFGLLHDTGNDIVRCTTANISADGLCIYLDKPVSEGDELAIGSILPIICKKATVRWMRKIGIQLYIAGLSCVSSP